jgi:two-component system LytT family response regulator
MVIRPIRTVVIDDEPLARRRVIKLLENREGYEIVGQFGSARDGLLALQELDADLVFLDIHMPEMDGFELLQAIDHNSPPVVIFVTAHAEHALRAFEFDALDYLLKPFDDERFEKTLARATETIQSEDAVTLRTELLDLLGQYWRVEATTADSTASRSGPANKLDRILIRDGERIFFQKVDEIDWIEAADYNVRIHIGKEVHQMRESLTRLEGKLDPRRFARIHRSVIVNIDQIAELQPYFNGAYVVLLKDGTELRLSRRRRRALGDLLGRSL